MKSSFIGLDCNGRISKFERPFYEDSLLEFSSFLEASLTAEDEETKAIADTEDEETEEHG